MEMNTGVQSRGAITKIQQGDNPSKPRTVSPVTRQTTRKPASRVDITDTAVRKQRVTKTDHENGTSLTGSDKEQQATGTRKQQQRNP